MPPAVQTNSAKGIGPRTSRMRFALCVGMLLALGGCAHARIASISMALRPPAPAPRAILVDVEVAPDAQASPLATKVATTLRADLIKRYQKAGIVVAAPTDNATAGAAKLHVNITRADPGNRLLRFVVGFGAGRSRLRTDAALDANGQEDHALTLATAASSGRRPGLILPGGVAAATGNLTGLAVGSGVRLAFATRSTFGREADRSAKLIVNQTLELYRKAGWALPGDKPSKAMSDGTKSS